MSVLIKDMEKPKSCYAVIDGESEYCPFVNTDDDCVLLLKKGTCEGTWEEQYSKCPLVETPESCEDAVSRADVENEIANLLKGVFVEYEDIAKKATAKLPSVTPKPDQYEDALKKIKNTPFVGSDGLDYIETLQALDALKDAIGVTLHVAKISKHCSDFSDLDEVIECEDAVSRADVKEIVSFECGEWRGLAKSIIKKIENLPSAQPEIIRCKDCKWWSNDDYRECSNPNYDDGYVTPAGFYCGYATKGGN